MQYSYYFLIFYPIYLSIYLSEVIVMQSVNNSQRIFNLIWIKGLNSLWRLILFLEMSEAITISENENFF